MGFLSLATCVWVYGFFQFSKWVYFLFDFFYILGIKCQFFHQVLMVVWIWYLPYSNTKGNSAFGLLGHKLSPPTVCVWEGVIMHLVLTPGVTMQCTHTFHTLILPAGSKAFCFSRSMFSNLSIKLLRVLKRYLF